jgi:hypothetical protein
MKWAIEDGDDGIGTSATTTAIGISQHDEGGEGYSSRTFRKWQY